MTRSAALIRMAALCGFAAASAHAGSLGVGPTRIELDAATRVQALTVQNTGSVATLIQVDTHRWQQSDKGDDLSPAPELAATPRVFELKPGETRIVRVGLRDQKPLASEGTYRLYVREVQNAEAGDGAQLRYLMQVGVPVFISPAGPAGTAAIGWTLDQDTAGCARLRLVNDGKRRARLLAIDYREKGQSVWRSEAPQYLLAGTRRAIPAAPCLDPANGSAGELVVHTESGEQRVPRLPASRQ
jgi:fimbrial chaperone protein